MIEHQFVEKMIIASAREALVERWVIALQQFWTISIVRNDVELEHELRMLSDSIILLDISLPGFAHNTALENFCGRHPESKIIVITNTVNPEMLIGFLLAGAKGYCSYDIPGDLLKKAIETVADGGNWIERKIVNLMLTAIVEQHRTEFNKSLSKSMNSISGLTQQELEVSIKVGQGCSDKEIAKSLDISIDRLNGHVKQIYEKLDISGAEELASIMNKLLANIANRDQN